MSRGPLSNYSMLFAFLTITSDNSMLRIILFLAKCSINIYLKNQNCTFDVSANNTQVSKLISIKINLLIFLINHRRRLWRLAYLAARLDPIMRTGLLSSRVSLLISLSRKARGNERYLSVLCEFCERNDLFACRCKPAGASLSLFFANDIH